MANAQQIDAGRKLAGDLAEALEFGGNVAANQIRSRMSQQDMDALFAFREHELATIVALVEDSPDGAAIRWEAAKQVYANQVSDAIRASNGEKP